MKRPIARLLAPAIAVLLAHAVRLILLGLVGPDLPPFLTSYPAVVFVALLFGFWPGVVTTGTATLVANYFYLHPTHKFALDSGADVVETVFFFVMGIIMSAVAESEHRSRHRISEVIAEADDKQQSTERRLQEALLSLTVPGHSSSAFVSLLASVPDAVLITDASGRVVESNPAYTKLPIIADGSECIDSPGGFINHFDLFDAEGNWCDVDQWPVSKALRGESAVNDEYTARRKDNGETLVGSYSFGPIRNDQGKVTGSVTIIRDVCRERANEEALRRNYDRLRLSLESANLVDWELDLRTQRLFRTIEHDQLYGFESSCENWTYETFLGFVLPEYREFAEKGFANLIATGSGQLEVPIRRLDGEVRWIWSSAKVTKNIRGEAMRVIGVSTDSTERKALEAQLSSTAERLQFAVDVTKLGEWKVDLATGAVKTSGYYDEILGHTHSTNDTTWETFITQIHPEDLPKFEANHHKAIATGSTELELRIRRADGKPAWVWIHSRLLRDATGQPTSLAGTILDISKRKWEQEALQRRESELRLAQRAAGFGIFVFDMESGERIASPEMFEIFGLPPDQPFPDLEILEKIIHPEDRESAKEQYSLTVAGQFASFEMRIIRSDGQIRWIDVSAKAENGESGRTVRLVGACRDVTQRKRIEQESRETEEQLRLAQSSTNLGTFIVDLKTGNRIDSAEMFRIFAVPKGSPFPDFNRMVELTHPDDREHLKQQYAQLFEGKPVMYERRIVLPDGETRWIETSARVETDDAGKPTRIVGVCQDVTKRKENETAARRNEERLRMAQQTAGLGVFVVEIPHGTIYGNFDAFATYGIQIDKPFTLGGLIEGIAHPDDREMLRTKTANILRGEPVIVRWRAVAGNGRVRWLETYAKPEYDAHHKVSATLVVIRDITEMLEMRGRINQSEAKLQAALANMTDAVWISDTDGHFIDFNEAFATVHRFKDKSECFSNLDDYPSILEVRDAKGEILSLDQWALPRALRGETATNMKFRLRRKDTGEEWVGSSSCCRETAFGLAAGR